MREYTKVNQSSAAIHNRRLAIQLLRQHGSLSRRQLAQITGLRTSTLTYIVRDLMRQKIVRTVGKAKSTTVGKKQILLEIDPDYGWVVGLGLEPTCARIVYMDAAGQVLDKDMLEVSGDVNDQVTSIHSHVRAWAEQHRKPMDSLIGVGAGVSGMVDANSGCVISSEVFDQTDVPLRDILAKHFNMPAVIDSDANAATLSESRFGEASESDGFVFVRIDPRANCESFTPGHLDVSICLQGRIYRGSHNAAGRLGTLMDGYSTVSLSDQQWTQMADPDAPICEDMNDIASRLASVLSTVTDLIDPQAVVLGGHLPINNRQVIAQISQQLNETLSPVRGRRVGVYPSRFEADAPAVGAAVSACDIAMIEEYLTEPAAIPEH